MIIMILQQLQDQEFINFGSALALGLVEMLIAFFALRLYIQQKSRLLLYFALAWTALSFFFVLNGVSIFIDSVLTFQISYIVFLPASIIFWFAFVDTTMHENIGLKKMCIAIGVCAVLATFTVLAPWTFDLNQAAFVIADPSANFWFFQVSNVIYFMMMISYSYFATITYRKSPPTLKPLARIFFVSGIFSFIAAIIQFYNDPIILLLQSIIVIAITAIAIIIIKKEPRIVHLLPYTVYRLLITSANGPSYYSKTWADLDLDDNMLSGLLSAIRTNLAGTVSRAIPTGAISELRMDKAILLTEMHYAPLTIVLLTSKASMALKKALADFGAAFSKQFYDSLYDVNGFAKEVTDANAVFSKNLVEPLILKYFRSVPSFIESQSSGIIDPIADAKAKDEKVIDDNT